MIEVGEYVRTILGNITKVVAVKDTVVWTDDFVDGFGKYHEGIIKTTDIVKHSKNIIDLIEEGDYVNGKYVCSIGTAIGNLPIINHTDGTFTPSNLIESIVTKEQFEAVKYEIK